MNTKSLKQPYVEQAAPLRGFFWLAVVAGLAYAINLGVRQMDAAEAVLAIVAREMGAAGIEWTNPTVYGEHVPIYPLYVWCLQAFQDLSLPPAWTVRIPSVIGVIGIALAATLFAGRAIGPMAVAPAAMAAATNGYCINAGLLGGGDALFGFTLGSAWLAWYGLGPLRRQWTAAWGISLALVGLACLTKGVLALPLFYLPLFLFRRGHFRVWRRMLLPAHLIFFVLFTGTVCYLLAIALTGTAFPWIGAGVRLVAPFYQENYLLQLIVFPFHAALMFMPWTLLLWPAFCSAYASFEKNPRLTRYLRTVLIAGFVAIWLVPGTGPLSLLPLVGPAVVLTALHYEIPVRRYWPRVRGFVVSLLRIVRVLAVFALLVSALHFASVIDIEKLERMDWIRCVAGALAATLFAHWLTRKAKKAPGIECWLGVSGLVVVLTLLTMQTITFLQPFYGHPAAKRAERLVKFVPEDMTVYKLTEHGLVRELVHVPHAVRQINSADDLPEDQSLVYLLGGGESPVTTEWAWTECGSVPVAGIPDPVPLVKWSTENRYLISIEALQTRSEKRPERAENGIVRMYRGRRRESM